MSKKIIVCCDGTWNEPGEAVNGVKYGTNVWKIYSLMQQTDSQIPHYIPGVGVGNVINKLAGGIFGQGINDNILKAYSFIANHYESSEDKIYLLGFSRGAYTARSVAGLIRNCGILKKEFLDNKIMETFRRYRNKDEYNAPDSIEMKAFRSEFSSDAADIEFIGVWDTVGSLGIPINTFASFNDVILENQFHDTRLSSYVKNAFHAMAIDEKRSSFLATLWQQSNAAYKKAAANSQRMEQVWFAGVHSNVGGGYPNNRLGDVSLRWMIARARECGVDFDDEKIGASLSDGIFDKIENSRKSFYRIAAPSHRKIYARRDSFEKVHHSVIKRMDNISMKYQPENLLHALGLGVGVDYRD